MFQKIKKISADKWLWCFLVIVHILLIAVMMSQFMVTNIVCGDSMNPTLNDGMWMIAVFPGKIEPGDVVVADSQYLNTKIIKRVIGVPGDTVAIVGNTVYRNGRPQTETYLPSSVSMDDMIPVTLQEGQYFLMGDNRDNSLDSRFFGPVSGDEIIYKVPLSGQLWLWGLRLAIGVVLGWLCSDLIELEVAWMMTLWEKSAKRRKELAVG